MKILTHLVAFGALVLMNAVASVNEVVTAAYWRLDSDTIGDPSGGPSE